MTEEQKLRQRDYVMDSIRNKEVINKDIIGRELWWRPVDWRWPNSKMPGAISQEHFQLLVLLHKLVHE